MKTFIILLVCLAGYSMRAQSGPAGQEFKTNTPQAREENIELQPALKPNQMAGPRSDITYSGIAVQAVKTDNPLQLINPFAPASYGSGADNLDRDIITSKENGLKFFSIDF
jgi:hypothetical protein